MSSATAYLIVGDDPYLVSEQLHRLLEHAPPLAVDEFEAEADPSAIVQALGTSAMFGGTRTVLVRAVDAMGVDGQKALTQYLENPSPDSTLIMTAVRPVPRLSAAVKKVGRVIEAVKGRRSDILNWLAQQSKAKGVKLTGEAMAALVESAGESPGALAGALDELALAHAPGTRLGKKEIIRQFQHRPEARLFSFVDAVAERRQGEALDALGRLTVQGEAPQMLLWNLVRHFRLMLASQGDSPAAVARDLAVQPWRAEKLVRQAKAFSAAGLSDALIALAEADHKMKKTEEPGRLTLERTVVAICGR